MMEIKKVKVVKVTKTEFELEDGRVYEHPIELDEVPTIKEFQEIYDEWVIKFKDMFAERKDDE